MTSFMKIMSLMNELRIECVRKREKENILDFKEGKWGLASTFSKRLVCIMTTPSSWALLHSCTLPSYNLRLLCLLPHILSCLAHSCFPTSLNNTPSLSLSLMCCLFRNSIYVFWKIKAQYASWLMSTNKMCSKWKRKIYHTTIPYHTKLSPSPSPSLSPPTVLFV